MKIEQVHELPDISALIAESQRLGFNFLKRLADDWHSGDNRFTEVGEAFFAVFEPTGRCVAVGGVNLDPNEIPNRGRIRRVYVSENFRGQGVGRALITQIELWSRSHFQSLSLFTSSDAAAKFYEALGYEQRQISELEDQEQLRVDHVKAVKRRPVSHLKQL